MSLNETGPKIHICDFPEILLTMPNSKSQRAEKISTDQLTDETLDVINEMLNIIVSRTQVRELDKGRNASERCDS